MLRNSDCPTAGEGAGKAFFEFWVVLELGFLATIKSLFVPVGFMLRCGVGFVKGAILSERWGKREI